MKKKNLKIIIFLQSILILTMMLWSSPKENKIAISKDINIEKLKDDFMKESIERRIHNKKALTDKEQKELQKMIQYKLEELTIEDYKKSTAKLIDKVKRIESRLLIIEERNDNQESWAMSIESEISQNEKKINKISKNTNPKVKEAWALSVE